MQLGALDRILRSKPAWLRTVFPKADSATEALRCDGRRHPRSNVALAAELVHSSGRIPVTIGNLSPGGALLKTSLLPSPGAALVLTRGGLYVEATVTWCSAGNSGVAFREEIRVGEWVLPLANVGQRRIDQLVTLIKSGQAGPEATEPPSDPLPPRSAYPQLMADFGMVLELVRDLKDDLSASAVTVELHSGALERLDAATGMLSNEQLNRLPRTQVIAGMSEPFELLRDIEDEITSCDETLARHGYKLQHLDLAMQMMEEIAASSLIGDSEQPACSSRLPRLRTACEHALGPK